METRFKYNKAKIVPLELDKNRHTESLDKPLEIVTVHEFSSPKLRRIKESDNDINDSIFRSKVKKDALRWKSFATSRRARISNSLRDNLHQFGRIPSCLGLEVINQLYDQTDGKDRELNNRLIHYFATLGNSQDVNQMIDLELVDSLIESGADINGTDKHGQTILHEVAKSWHTDVALYMIQKGINVNQGDKFGRTPLHVAAAVDYAEMVELLIKHKADIEAKTKGENQTPVFYAAKNDAVHSLKALVKRNCQFMDIEDYKGRTPVYVAAELDRSETTKLLLEMGATGYSVARDGSRAVTWMINKMPPVAFEALNQMHLKDRPNRKQRFPLNYVFCEKEMNPSRNNQTSLHFAVGLRQYDLIMHPIFKRLLDVMWKQFGKKWAWINLCLNLIYILLWTVLGIVVEYDKRHTYNLPEDTWRIILFILAALMTFYQIYEEIMEFKRSQNHHEAWEDKRNYDIDQDLKHCHPRWPEEEKYLLNEKAELDKLKPKYFKDAWNVFDWICYVSLLACMATHVADILAHSEVLARVHIRIMAITIIFLWLRLMKHARAFELLGPFIVMLGHMLVDCARFIFLYLEFYIPYLTAFWMIFGGTKMAADDSTEEVTVSGFTYPGEIFFSTFRLTLVDDYDYDSMQKIDSIMADILLGTWFMLSAILCLNLFIALLSDTFQRVYDNAQANSVMQRAIFLLNTWESMSTSRKVYFIDYITSSCSPLIEDYDDDMTQSGDEDIKKITVQIKENLDNLHELFKLQFGDPRSNLTDDQGNENNKELKPLARTNSEVEKLKKSLIAFRNEQFTITSQIQKDLFYVKSMLKQTLNLKQQSSDFQSPDVTEALSEESRRVRRRKKEKLFKTKRLEIEISGLEDTELVPASFPDFSNMHGHSHSENVSDSTNC